MNKIIVPKSYNYISAFLTFACNFKCSYCINKYNGLYKYKLMKPEEWAEGLNRIKTRSDLPCTITGGEPTVYKGFYKLVNLIDKDIPLDLLTNGQFNIQTFKSKISPKRFKRPAKYASIRFSFHPGYTSALSLLIDVRNLQKFGYSVGVWAVDNGDYSVARAMLMAKGLGIDFRTKELLDEAHGAYKYPAGVDGIRKKCICRPSEMLIAPDGRLFRCHYDLYHGINSYGHLLDKRVDLPKTYLPCDNYGMCNPCDIKMKFNRFQEEGHCSVKIKEKNV